MGKQKPYLCNACNRRFTTSTGANEHCVAKHEGGGVVLFRPKQRKPKPGPDRGDDESFADRAIQAEIDIASGLGSDDKWLLP